MNLAASREEKFRPYSAPAIPARKAETTNAFMRKAVTLMPTDSAAIRLSRTALMARPSLELMRFSTTNRVNSTSPKPTAKVEMRLMPVMPMAPERIHLCPLPISLGLAVASTKRKPLSSMPTYMLPIRFFMISPKARVTIAR